METLDDIKAQRDQFKQFYQTEQHARTLLSEQIEQLKRETQN